MTGQAQETLRAVAIKSGTPADTPPQVPPPAAQDQSAFRRSRATEAVPPPHRLDGSRQYLRSKAVQLPRSIHRRLTEEASHRGTTATALMLTAVNSTYHLLPDAVGGAAANRPTGGLFDIPQDRALQEPTVQTTLRMTDAQIEAIDELVKAISTNRSRLFATAVTLYLK